MPKDPLIYGDLKDENIFLTPKARLNFPFLFEVKPDNGKFSCSLMFNKKTTDLSLLEKMIIHKLEIDFPNIPYENIKLPVKDGDRDGKYKQYPEYTNCLYLNAIAQAKRPPALVGLDRELLLKDSQPLYSGCYVRAILNIFSYPKPGKPGPKGISLGIKAIQKLSDGEPITTTASLVNHFGPLEEKPKSDLALFDDNPFASQIEDEEEKIPF
jgi:hypothetical protein